MSGQSSTNSAANTASSANGASMSPFDFAPRTRVVFGAGTLARLGEIAAGHGRRAFLVSDKGVRAAGHEARAIESLKSANLEVVVFDDVQPNPTTDDVDRGLQVAREGEVDCIIGLGGGSSMDCAKGVNFLLTNGGRMADYWGVGKATQPMLPMIAVPTTAGTGSEAQSFALIANAETHMKMACGDAKAACAVAILDPELTTSMPAAVTAATGIDAISHAIESFVTKKRTPLSQLFSHKAWQLLASGFPRVLADPADIEARGAMLLGAHFAGAAIENSMLGATHALANPLSAHFEITHGVAIGVMLPHVIRFNEPEVGMLYSQLGRDAGIEDLASFLQSLVADCGQATNLASCGVDESAIPMMAEEAAKQWTGTFNPRPVSADQFAELYRSAFKSTSVPAA